ncbi:hypothetical protein [Phosphitispora fastidiosa]|uniref:hypothetical protein n=1 Tax=Phosphitispora fastidiosa TaxID=2837202 RepID=UPI001E46EF80|nr:hypothetical protein [Phosphitispora fastidiosa]MBU7007239.1 hypothetical protein [Phosphitispora fastidiosa]
MTKYCISDLILEIAAPEWTLHDNLKLFSCRHGDPDVCCRVEFKKRPQKPAAGVKIIADTPGTMIYEDKGHIHNLSGDDHDIPSYTVASGDWFSYTMYIDPKFNNPDDDEIVHIVKDGIFASLRGVMIGRLAQKNGVIIHSSTILWQDRGIMFPAPSGTGKSTHAHLWQQLYHTPILDGDAAACRIADGTPVVYGLPWCGTSGEFLNQSAPLGAIVFLQQAEANSIIKLGLQESILRLAARCFLLPWNEGLMHQYLDTVQEIAARTDCYLLNCLPDAAAVELVKKCL